MNSVTKKESSYENLKASADIRSTLDIGVLGYIGIV